MNEPELVAQLLRGVDEFYEVSSQGEADLIHGELKVILDQLLLCVPSGASREEAQ